MKKPSLSGGGLKLAAIVSMLIDHATAVLMEATGLYRAHYRLYLALRIVGRLAFPIFAFFIAEGFLHTRNRGRYLLRLTVFALLSEVPFDLAFNGGALEFTYQNVCVTLALGLLSLMAWEALGGPNFGEASFIRKAGAVLAVGACAVMAELMKTDYGAAGVLTVFVMYVLREMEWPRNIAAIAVLSMASWLEVFAAPDWLLFHFYNGQRGNVPKYLFYFFYPVHLILLVGIRFLIFGV